MKKTYRRSQKKDILGHCIGGLKMYKYGLPYRNAWGHIFPHDTDLMDLMFIAVEKHPELHIVTRLNKAGEFKTLNRYEPVNAKVHYLYTGNADPDIEFTDEFSIDDWTQEEIDAQERFLHEFRTKELSPIQVAAVNFAINAALKTSD